MGDERASEGRSRGAQRLTHAGRGRARRAVATAGLTGLVASLLSGAVLPTAATAAVGDEITGTIWQDYDSNGTFDSYESGLAGIEVLAYDGAGNVAGPVTTDGDGSYALPVTSDADRWRVEANVPDTPQLAQWRDSVVGRGGEPSNGTTVQFADIADGAGASGVDFSFQVPSAYVENNPLVYVPVMHYGPSDGPYAGAAAGTTIRYDAESPAGGALVPQTGQVPFSAVGSTNGSVIARPTAPGEPATVFTAAYVRRHVGLGPEGIGAIYRVTPDGESWEAPTASAELYLDVTDFGIDLGGPDQSAPAGDPHGLRPDVTADNPQYDWSRDAQAWGQVGRSGLGTIALSADEQYLYAVNLHNRSLIQIDTGGSVDGLPANVTEIELDDYFPDDSDLRPYGVSANPLTNEMYLTATNTAESTQDVADLAGYVYSFDPAAPGQLREVLSFPLDFPRTGFQPTWFPWATDISHVRLQGAVIRSAMPVVGDAKYLHGDLVVGVRDLAGDLFGGYAYISGDPADGNATSSQIRSEGDVYIAAPAGDGTFVMENNGVHRGITGDGALQGEGGPGGLRYFDTGYTQFDQDNEAGGSIVVVPSRADGVLTTGVHVANGAGQSGVRRLFQEGGQAHDPRGAVIIHGFQEQPDVTSKGNGLGSATALASAAPIEIGNYVWYDVDNDGVQDPDEAPVEGATVNLYEVAADGTRTLVSTTTTNALGEYYFSSDDAGYALQTGTNYVVGIDDPADYAEGGPLYGWYPTVENTGDPDSPDADRNDSDGVVEETADGDFPYAVVTTGGPGENDHTIDFGYSQLDYEFDKRTVSGPTESPDDDGTWSVVYELVAQNTGLAPGGYLLTDDLTGYGEGIEIVSTEVVSGPDGAALNADWDGTEDLRVIAERQPIAAGGEDVYTLEVTVRLTTDADTGEADVAPENIQCTEGQQAGDATTGLFNSATLDPVGHEDLVDDECGDLPLVTLDKTVDVEPHVVDRAGQPGLWEVTYGLTVTNETEVATDYDLEDTLRFGDAVSIEGVTVTAPDGITPNAAYDGLDETVIVSDEPITGGAVHEYLVTVQYRFTLPEPPVDPDPSDCTLVAGLESGTGLFNDALTTFNGYPSTDNECRELGQVTHDKTLVSAQPVGDGQWQVDYEIEVRNKGVAATFYDLDDALRYTEEVTVVSADVTSAPAGVETNADWDGVGDVRVATGADILGTDDAGYAPHVYEVTVLAEVPLSFADDVLEEATTCAAPGSGTDGGRALSNTTLLTDEAGEQEVDEACAELPSIAIDKTVSDGPAANGDGTWTITYDVVATNDGGAAGVYDLLDELRYGEGILIESAEVVTTPEGVAVAEDWDGIEQTLVAADVELPAGDAHTYQVAVVVSLDEDTVTPEALTCPEPGSGESGGLANGAELEHNDLTDADEACASLPLIAVTKSVVSEPAPAEGQTGAHTIGYELLVTNEGAGAGEYDLDDSLRLGEGITVHDTVVTTDVVDSAPLNEGFDGLEDVRVVSDQGIAGATEGRVVEHRYLVTVTYTVDLTAVEDPAAVSDCALEDGESGSGLTNLTAVEWNTYTGEDVECREVGEPTLDKTLVSAEPVGEGQWLAVYDLVVGNLGAGATSYDLADELYFGEDVAVAGVEVTGPSGVDVNADWDGVEDLAIATDVALAGVTDEDYADHVYTVSVLADVPLSFADGAGKATACLAEPGSNLERGGLNNVATLTTDAGDERVDTDCAPLPSLELEKTVADGPTANEDGTWTITYGLEVANSGDAEGSYVLRDQLRFGAGVDIEEVTVRSVAGDVPVLESFTGQGGELTDPENAITDSVAIAAGATHAVEVTVVVSVDTRTATVESLQCGDGDDADGRSGLRNVASIGHNGLQGADAACSALAVPPDVELPSTGVTGVGWAALLTTVLTLGGVIALVTTRRVIRV